MKKLSIIAGLVFTSLFFASCEQQEIIPKEYVAAPVVSRTFILESDKRLENQAKKESYPKLRNLMPTIDIEKGSLSVHN
jgi:PBP1b-binding outer membrane lipoprotein LpoB